MRSSKYQQDKVMIILQDVHQIMHISKTLNRLITVDLSKQKALDAVPKAIQQIVFQGVARGDDNTKIRLNTILEKPKETVLDFYKETAKFL